MQCQQDQARHWWIVSVAFHHCHHATDIRLLLLLLNIAITQSTMNRLHDVEAFLRLWMVALLVQTGWAEILRSTQELGAMACVHTGTDLRASFMQLTTQIRSQHLPGIPNTFSLVQSQTILETLEDAHRLVSPASPLGYGNQCQVYSATPSFPASFGPQWLLACKMTFKMHAIVKHCS